MYYGGDFCDVYHGPCDCHCGDMGCYGPTASECNSCRLNAGWVDGDCQCLEGYGGTCCEEYTGPCFCGCDTCHGPLAGECDMCWMNTHRNNSTGVCECDGSWSGQCCDMYSGTCPCNCNKCDNAGNCIECATNAHFPEDSSSCMCDDFYGGECCSYIGTCPCTCDICFGPEDWQCTKCAENAYWNGSMCACDASSGFISDGNGCCVYDGDCHCNCANGCNGPSSMDCIECIDNAVRDDAGYCVCDSDWENDPFNGDAACCSTYRGRCDWICTACVGPTAFDCVECRNNAHLNDAGACVCDNGWSGEHCDTWIGECDCHCLGCGLGFGNCDQCVPNAQRVNGVCTCKQGWNSEDACCDVYTGDCHCACGNDGCTGPDANQCNSCAANAYWNDYGECTCDRCWGQEFNDTGCCTNYSCGCNCKCAPGYCSGPNDTQCEFCAANAHHDDSGKCVCNSGYGGPCC